MNQDIDLRQLVVRREPGATVSVHRRRHVLTRYLLPGAVLLGFLAVLGWSARDSVLPSQAVTVVPVLTTRAEIRQEGAPLFQAAGWVEPRPTPVVVTALAEGVVETLLVAEGQEVKAAQPVARLIDADARLALDAAEADLAMRRAEVASARAALQAARTNLEKPTHLEAAVAESDAMLAQKETELSGLPFQLRTAESRRMLAETNYETMKRSNGVIPDHSIRAQENELKAATASVAELKSREPRLRREVEALTGRRDAQCKRLALKTDEIRQVGEADAGLQAAEARVRQAEAAVGAARLKLERMIVRAPTAGRVLALVARPGTRLMGMAPHSMQDSSTVVTLYDPMMLQIRADVRLDDVGHVLPGQGVRIETAAVPQGTLDGQVLFATSQADIQKNTLQVKVAINAPPAVLKPDMLVQVTFLAPPTPKAPSSDSEPLRLLVPRLLVESADGGARVWVADQTVGVARLRAVTLGQTAGDLVEVVDGLTPADRLIAGDREGLRDGQRITVTGEETGGGAVHRSSAPRPGRLTPRPAGNDGHAGKH